MTSVRQNEIVISDKDDRKKTTTFTSYRKFYVDSPDFKKFWQYHTLEQKLDILFHPVWGVIYVRTGQELDKAGPIWPTSVKKKMHVPEVLARMGSLEKLEFAEERLLRSMT